MPQTTTLEQPAIDESIQALILKIERDECRPFAIIDGARDVVKNMSFAEVMRLIEALNEEYPEMQFDPNAVKTMRLTEYRRETLLDLVHKSASMALVYHLARDPRLVEALAKHGRRIQGSDGRIVSIKYQ